MSDTPCHCTRFSPGDVEGLPGGGRLYHGADECADWRQSARDWQALHEAVRGVVESANLRADMAERERDEARVKLHGIITDAEAIYDALWLGERPDESGVAAVQRIRAERDAATKRAEQAEKERDEARRDLDKGTGLGLSGVLRENHALRAERDSLTEDVRGLAMAYGLPEDATAADVAQNLDARLEAGEQRFDAATKRAEQAERDQAEARQTLGRVVNCGCDGTEATHCGICVACQYDLREENEALQARLAEVEGALRKISTSVCGLYNMPCSCTAAARAALREEGE